MVARRADRKRAAPKPRGASRLPTESTHDVNLSEQAINRLAVVLERLADVTERVSLLLDSDNRATPPARSSLPMSVEARRSLLKPATVRVLFVTTPIFPEDPTNFYLANSHLFRCIRGAFIRSSDSRIPSGEEFLWWFRDHGCWLHHAPFEPAQGPGRPSTHAVEQATEAIAQVIRESDPTYVVCLKARLIRRVDQAITKAASTARLLSVPTPRALWDSRFVDELHRILVSPIDPAEHEELSRSDALLGAIQRSILDGSNRRRRAHHLAAEIEADRSWPMAAPTKAEVSAVLRSHSDLFDVNSAGVRLRDVGDARGRRGAPTAITG